jgi:uncharacterized protein
VIRSIVAFLAGALFAIGLGISGMTKPSKVVGFLDLAGAWDPSLMLVMAGAVGVHFTLRRFIVRREAPLWNTKFDVPTWRHIDGRLVLGAAIFGVGWGLGGFCPGPGIVAAASALVPGSSVSSTSAGVGGLVFLAGMTIGTLASFRFGRSQELETHEIS